MTLVLVYNLCISPTCISPKPGRFFQASKLPNFGEKKKQKILWEIYLWNMNNSGFLNLIFFQILAILGSPSAKFPKLYLVSLDFTKFPPKKLHHPKNPYRPGPMERLFWLFFPIRGCVGVLKIAIFEGGRILRGTKHLGPKPRTSPAVQGQRASLPHDMYRGGKLPPR